MSQALRQERFFEDSMSKYDVPDFAVMEKAILKLLEIDQDAKAIVSSGYSNDKVLAEYLQHGFKGVVVKPYQVEDLDQAVREALNL